MEQSRVEQQRRGEIANCALLRDNIVMLDYPSACWHRPASPWTHNPAEKQPSANGVFYGGLFSAYTVQSDITLACAFHRAHLSGIFSGVLYCEPSAASLGSLASVVLLCFALQRFPVRRNQHSIEVISAQHPQSRWAVIKILFLATCSMNYDSFAAVRLYSLSCLVEDTMSCTVMGQKEDNMVWKRENQMFFFFVFFLSQFSFLVLAAFYKLKVVCGAVWLCRRRITRVFNWKY